MVAITCQLKTYIQPFERELALDELEVLSSNKATPIDGDKDTANVFSIESQDVEVLRKNLAYWEAVGSDIDLNITDQSRSEATSNVARNGIDLEQFGTSVRGLVEEKLPTKRCLRYASHGIHEYRGKFFPQLVRSLINASNIPSDGIVYDPMCGSGTTLVETIISGRNAYGSDMNPLSVFISKVKCNALSFNVNELIACLNKLNKLIDHQKLQSSDNFSYFSTLNNIDQAYLRKWFSEQTLDELDTISIAISELEYVNMRDFFRVALSNIIRTVSWQKNADLRVRKEVSLLPRGKVIELFKNEAKRSCRLVAAFLVERINKPIGLHHAAEASATESSQHLQHLVGKVDAVVTSPPYATALPYLDTDRLSLLYLGLLNREQHRIRDLEMIGNREISEKKRVAYWAEYLNERRQLPNSVQTIIERIDDLNTNSEVGFRRKNLSALLAKYFFDMRKVFIQQNELLRNGGSMFMVVGDNRTKAGGEDIHINTSELLAEIACENGYELTRSLDMEMLTSRDIFKKNAMSSERIISLKKS